MTIPAAPSLLAFNPRTIHEATDDEYKTGRRHPWAKDRVM
jgi:hypothetical protein